MLIHPENLRSQKFTYKIDSRKLADNIKKLYAPLYILLAELRLDYGWLRLQK